MLALANLSRDTTYAYLGEGLSHEIASGLARLKRLEVRGPSEVERAQAAAPGNLRAIGRRLAVRYLVEGEIQYARDRVRVSVRLVRADNGTLRWGDSYTRPSGDLLAIQEEIARAVATNIAGVLGASELGALSARPTSSAAAYDDYLRGNHYFLERSQRAAFLALDAYQAAVRQDAAFVLARARIAMTYAQLIDYDWEPPGISEDSLRRLGMAAADSALARAPDIADAWTARAYLLSNAGPLALSEALDAASRAVDHDVRNVEAHNRLGWVLLALGRDSAAEAEARRALMIDPTFYLAYYMLGRIAFIRHEPRTAALRLDSALILTPGYEIGLSYRARARRLAGDLAGAREDAAAYARVRASTSRVSDKHDPAMLMALVDASGQAVDSARAAAMRSLASGHPTRITAMVLIAVGDTGRALDVLEGSTSGTWGPLHEPEYDPVRDTSRFRRLLARLRPPGAEEH